ncbi:hypothetical protein QCD70_00735 [Agreia sp. PsM10]|uniref:hypothetical protein n=1 Tax=Agreia sp. PsM10 TaxID=3030533 RepID=UPI00263A422B|nr:hypothetical protein [Agreia sp. PsM10]MDN4638758.1 hypothetical protein [Agreia sp. PsM10]
MDNVTRRAGNIRVLMVVAILLAGIHALVAFGVGVPVVPGVGPQFQAPAEIRVTLTSGESLTLTARYEGAESLAKIGWFDSYDELAGPFRFTSTRIDETNYVGQTVPVTLRSDSRARTRMILSYSSERDGARPPVIDDEFNDKSVLYFSNEGGLPNVSEDDRVDEALDHSSERYPALAEVTTSDPAVVAIEARGGPRPGDLELIPGGNADTRLWAVVFDYAALHQAGRTNLSFPLSWYGSPPLQWWTHNAWWICAAFLGFTAVLLTAGGAPERRRERAKKRARRELPLAP